MAYLRLLGQTQVEVAEATGCSAASIIRWEASSWWPEYLTEAANRWLQGTAAKARVALHRGLDAESEPIPSGNLALKVLERLVPELAPPTVKADLTSGGEPLPSTIRVVLIDAPEPEDG